MNKTTSITIVAIVSILILGGIVYAVYKAPDDAPLVTNNPTQTNNQPAQTNTAGAPTVTTATKAIPTDTTVVLNGQVNPNGFFTNYWFEYGTTSNLGKNSSSQMIGSGFTKLNTPAYITGLSKNTDYYFRLVGENQYAKVFGEKYSFRTTDGVSSPVGSVPFIKTIPASSVSKNAVSLNGEVNPNQTTTNYWFEYGKTDNLGQTSESISAGDGNTRLSESLTVSNLDAGTTYYFRINAQNQFGTVNGSILSFKTLAPASATLPKISNQNVTAINKTSATFHGNVNPGGADTNYWFEYSTDSVLSAILINKTNEGTIATGAGTPSVSAGVSNLNSNTTYYFRLFAQNSLGTVYGDKVMFKTKRN
jgi:phosphodiesterase/alkaline phosphatase D-like protein